MPKSPVRSDILTCTTFLPETFNKKKFSLTYQVPSTPYALELQNLGKNQCLGKSDWPTPEKINGWMLSAETATFMKAGGLGMIASELPDIFNLKYGINNENLKVVTPMYIGDTGKKSAHLDGPVYHGSEHCEITVKKGDNVSQGQVLGKSGTTEIDKDLGNHLHFEMYENGGVVNPENYLNKEVPLKKEN